MCIVQMMLGFRRPEVWLDLLRKAHMNSCFQMTKTKLTAIGNTHSQLIEPAGYDSDLLTQSHLQQ